MNPVITFEDVYFAYSASENILQGINLQVNAGEFIGIIGPNGGGKTTLLKLILGFLKPTQGKVTVFGTDPCTYQNQLAYVPQTQRFDRQFPISVMEVVLSGRLSHLSWLGRYSAKDKEIAHHALERVGLADYRTKPFGTLSGGQAQRTLIARALASEPRMILLDEPTASVDSRSEEEIYAILKTLQGTMTILMVTHDLMAAIAQVERVIVVQRNATSLLPQEVCEHYTMGLYHTPLLTQIGKESKS